MILKRKKLIDKLIVSDFHRKINWTSVVTVTNLDTVLCEKANTVHIFAKGVVEIKPAEIRLSAFFLDFIRVLISTVF